MKFFDALFSTLGGAASSILSVVACIALFSKPIRNKFGQYIAKMTLKEVEGRTEEIVRDFKENNGLLLKQLSEQNRFNELQIEALRSLLRNTITYIYYSNESNKTLRSYEAKTLAKHCEIYFKLGGNGFVKQLYEIMQTWRVIP